MTTKLLQTALKGRRVRLKHDVDRFSDFVAPKGATGTVDEVTVHGISVKMDERIEGAEHWENCILWHPDAEFWLDVELITEIPSVLTEPQRKRARFRVYEIEHHGDESAAISELSSAGCSEIKVIERDHEGEESIAVECLLPTGVDSPKKLALEFCCL